MSIKLKTLNAFYFIYLNAYLLKVLKDKQRKIFFEESKVTGLVIQPFW
jgi:hypothetical protein